MDYRRLGASGFTVPVLSFGTATFGGKGELFKAWGGLDLENSKRLVGICLDAGPSAKPPAYPYWRQKQFVERNPSPV